MLHLLAVAILALSLSGAPVAVEAQVSPAIIANKQMDSLLTALSKVLRETNTHMVNVIDGKVSFSKKVLLVTISGSASINGQLGDLSTLRRVGDAILSQSGSVMTLQGVFGADVGGNLRAAVSWNGLGVTGSVGVTLRDFRAFLRVTHDIKASGSTPELREVRLQSIGTLSVSIGGLGELDWVMGPISNAMAGIIFQVMNGWVGRQLFNALKVVVKLLRLG